MLFFDGAWGPLALLWLTFPFLYGDSADDPPVATALEARAQFPAGTVIIDADDHRTPADAYGASTVIRVDRDGRPTAHRTGVQDQVPGAALLDRLREFRSTVAVLDGPGRSPLGKTYLSTGVVEDGEPKELVPQTRIRIGFARTPNKNEDGPRVWDVLRAYVGCNRMGSATAAGELLTGGSLSIIGLGGTQVGCQPPLRDQEEWLTAFLTSKPSWRLDGDELTLTSGGTTITLLDRRIAEPDFTRNNTELSFSGVSLTDHACTADTATLQAAILATLGPAVAYTIDHNQLTLLAPSGRGLDLTADSPASAE